MNIRAFNLRPKLGPKNFEVVQKMFTTEVPELYKQYLIQYAGCSIKEDTFTDNAGCKWILASFSNSSDIMNLPKEFKTAGWGDWIVFGYDEGGWHYCINMSTTENYNSVFINRWTDHEPENQFVKIADSFEEFMQGLQEDNKRL